MRIGINPAKENKEISIESYHRVVIPVYIPNLEEAYFKDGLKILKLCIESLLTTIHKKTRVSLINNACCDEVTFYLNMMYEQNSQIDQLLNSKVNLGKVNALYSAIKSNLEPLITVADADVLFLNDWQNQVEDIFRFYPEAGMVSPVPSIGSLKGKFLKSTLGFAFLNRSIKLEKVKNFEAIKNFQNSIGKTNKLDRETTKYYTTEKNKKKVVLGCGHFMVTLKASVFNNSPKEPSKYKIVGGSEKQYIDSPNDKSGFLKLATVDNYGYHLGNKYECWMYNEFSNVLNKGNISKDSDYDFNVSKPLKLYYYFGLIIQYLFYRK
ncbi:glycosyltransferase family A protein [Lutibacter aestuarii]|uniref:Glycosyltransferase family A protein n=1 Tax=Lutibacter aestuarii TaxID=861111 RepID=A0ABW2Z839_9FLAO